MGGTVNRGSRGVDPDPGVLREYRRRIRKYVPTQHRRLGWGSETTPAGMIGWAYAMNFFFTSLTRKQANDVAIVLAVISFYVLDFALNALQASLRNLLLDITPPEQLSAGNAWHSRMTQAGNIVGYGFGFLPLASLPIIRLLGGDQFRKFCVIVIVVLVVTVWITCYTQSEEERILQRPAEGCEIFT